MTARELLTGPREYFVRNDGDDANDGLSNSPAGAFKTPQKPWDLITETIDLGGRVATIKLGGTFTSGISDAGGRDIKPGVVSITAIDTANIPTITASGARNDAVLIGSAEVVVSHLRVGGAGSGLHSCHSGRISVGDGMVYDTCVEYHQFVDNAGWMVSYKPYKIVGGAGAHYFQHTNGYLGVGPVAVTLQGTPHFSTAFAVSTVSGCIEAGGVTFIGAATGHKFWRDIGGDIKTGNAGPNYFPGSLPGVGLSGFYDDKLGMPSGDWAPVYAGLGSGSQAMSNGSWHRVGDLVFINARCTWSGFSGHGGAVIGGLPFAAAVDQTIPIFHSGVSAGSGLQLTTWLSGGSNMLQLVACDPNGGSHGSVQVEASGDILITGCYRAVP
ncbi:hypothetical protein OIU35_31480 [Boseaceae bacterium BT-24-1]|nr:hypothetical protein [Boseaceae bacterium BT-24-1]